MGTVKQAIEAIGTYGGEPRPRIAQIARFLQNDRMLPVNEGKWIKQISATHLTTLLLAVAAAPKAADATRSALTWGRLTPNGEPIDRDWDDPKRQRFVLAEIITGCIAMVWKEAGRGPLTNAVVQSLIEITVNRPHAIVRLDGKVTEYLPFDAGTDLTEFPGFHRVCRIPGPAIRSIATALHEGTHHNAILARQPDINRNPYHDPTSVLIAPMGR